MKKIFAVLGVVRNFVSRKVVYVVVGGALAGVKMKCPDCDLPSVDFITDVVLALLACHTLTDVVAIAGVTAGQYFENRAKDRSLGL